MYKRRDLLSFSNASTLQHPELDRPGSDLHLCSTKVPYREECFRFIVHRGGLCQMSSALENDEIMISDLEIMTSANNYRAWMYRRLAPFIGQRILEVGAGIGNFTEVLLGRELVVPTDKYEKC